MSSALRHSFQQLEAWLGQQIVGQKALVNRMMIALLAEGHLLVEGAPGLAKTRAVNALSRGVEASFQRIQFTPDLLPGDLTGTEIYHQQDGSFRFEKGPLFHDIILADEVNRAPAKVQSALLEAMAEKQITVGASSYPLGALFMVMATQNPLEQEGTYPLPEAQLDRFLLQVVVDYPSAEEELHILRLARQESITATVPSRPVCKLTVLDIEQARQAVLDLSVAEGLEEYMVQLVLASRCHESGSPAADLQYGASPRATIALDRCARAHAWLAGRDYVSPEDIHAIAGDVLRHRLILSYEAEARGVQVDEVIAFLIRSIPVP